MRFWHEIRHLLMTCIELQISQLWVDFFQYDFNLIFFPLVYFYTFLNVTKGALITDPWGYKISNRCFGN